MELSKERNEEITAKKLYFTVMDLHSNTLTDLLTKEDAKSFIKNDQSGYHLFIRDIRK
jgi:hypothetical protein